MRYWGWMKMNKLQVAEQFRKALQMFAQSLTNEEAMEVATIYPKYEVGKTYFEQATRSGRVALQAEGRPH
jgi:hypothetical protein